MIRLEHVQKVSDQATLIDVESLLVEVGAIAAVIGLLGSQKQALLDLLTGQAVPTAGTIEVAGLNPSIASRELSQRLGVLPAANSLYRRLTVRENLAFFGRLYGLPAARVEEVLVQVGLADRSAATAGELPPGLARRLAFGRAILHHPAALVLVEPFAECDVASVTLLTRLTRELAEETAILILALEATGLNQLCQKLYVAENGRIGEAHTPEMESPLGLPFKIPARLEGKVALVNPGDILYASAEEGRTCLYTATDQITTHLTLSELEERLARSGFFRAHRGYLVNLQHVKEVIAYTRNSYTLILDGSARVEIPLSKNAARDLRELLGY